MPMNILNSFVRASIAGFLIGATLVAPGCLGDRSSSTGPTDGQAMNRLLAEPLNSQPWQFGQANGTVISTQHYRIYTTIRDPLYQRLITRVLEAAYARAAANNPKARVSDLMDCYVFADRNQWELFTRLKTGADAEMYLPITAGGYARNGLFVGYDIPSQREITLSVIAHEAWHQYSWFAFKDRLPSWLEEGLATQNEAITWQGSEPQFDPAQNLRRWQSLRSAIQEKRLWSIRDLTTTHAGRVIKMSQKHVDAYYAQLWSLTLFLQQSKYNTGLQELLADAASGKLTQSLAGTGVTAYEISSFSERWNSVAGPTYLRRYIAKDVDALQREYEAWAREFTSTWPPKASVR